MTESKKISQDDIMKLLDSCYEKCLNGIPKISPDVKTLADDYSQKHKTKEEACKAMLKNQIVKCTTSGVVTGFGGAITLPVAIPANIGSVLYVQMRMIACTAYMAGFELQSDQTQTFVYACLAGVAVNNLMKQAGVKFGVKFANGLIKRIPGKVLTKINQKVGFRFLTKFGTKGLVNMGKLLPGVGAVIGGGLDFVETKLIADRAYKWFFKGNFDDSKSKNDEEVFIVEVDESDFDENPQEQAIEA
ncbi:MAG: EcsC family protein [Acutalibacteraceae bacterium]